MAGELLGRHRQRSGVHPLDAARPARSGLRREVGYPRLFNGEECNLGARISPGEQSRLNQTADLLRDVTRGRAQAAGFAFADAIPRFVGHAVCDDAEWLNGLSNPTSESYHPNRAGHSAGFAPLVRAIVG